MQDFRKLKVWQANRQFTLQIYKLTAKYPPEERFGLVSQMRRAVVRIGACIAEGCGKRTRRDTRNHFQTSFGGACEMPYHLITSLDLTYITQQEFDDADAKCLESRKMLSRLMWRLGGD